MIAVRTERACMPYTICAIVAHSVTSVNARKYVQLWAEFCFEHCRMLFAVLNSPALQYAVLALHSTAECCFEQLIIKNWAFSPIHLTDVLNY